MRNVKRVVLWGLPPSFCTLVQQAGRAARDFATLGEAILVIPVNVVKEGLKVSDMENTLWTTTQEAEAQNRDDEDIDVTMKTETTVTGLVGLSGQVTNAEGIRVEAGEQDFEPEDQPATKTRKGKHTANQVNTIEVQYLSLYVSGKVCQRRVWNEFFANNMKGNVTQRTS